MVVVPTFAVTPQRDQPVVAAVVASLIVAIARDVRERVHGPGSVQHENRPYGDGPDVPA